VAFTGPLIFVKLRRSEKLAKLFFKKLIVNPNTNAVEIICYEKNKLMEPKILSLNSIKIKFNEISTGLESYNKLYFTKYQNFEAEVFGQADINEWTPELLSEMYMTLKKIKR